MSRDALVVGINTYNHLQNLKSPGTACFLYEPFESEREKIMLSVRGIYESGQVRLSEPVPLWLKKAKVIVTILEEEVSETEDRDQDVDISIFNNMIGSINGQEDASVRHDQYIYSQEDR